MPETVTDPRAWQCPDCGTRVREGQLHTVGLTSGCKPHVVFPVSREYLRPYEEDETSGRAILYRPTLGKGRGTRGKPVDPDRLVRNPETGWLEVSR